MVSGKESGCGEGYGIPDSLLGKRGSVRVGSAQLFPSKGAGAAGAICVVLPLLVCGVYI